MSACAMFPSPSRSSSIPPIAAIRRRGRRRVFTLEDAVDGGIVGRGEIAFTLRRATNIHWQAQAVDKVSRSALKGQRPACLWFTGLSGSGKSTIATALEKRLNAMGLHTYTLDGDNVRHGLSRDLGFTDADRVENIRRIAEVSKLFVDAGLLVMVSFISPFRAERRMARGLLGPDEFLEIFVDTPIEICEQRDPKGLYAKARAGQLKNFTGIDSPYEPPEHAEIHIAGGEAPPEVLVERDPRRPPAPRTRLTSRSSGAHTPHDRLSKTAWPALARTRFRHLVPVPVRPAALEYAEAGGKRRQRAWSRVATRRIHRTRVTSARHSLPSASRSEAELWSGSISIPRRSAPTGRARSTISQRLFQHSCSR